MAVEGKGDRQQRVEVGLKISLKYQDRDAFAEHFSQNLSRSGIFIRAKDPAPVGSRVHFEYRLADDTRVMRGVGIVRWVRSVIEAEEPEQPPGMGIEFVDLDGDTEELIGRIVARFGEGRRAPRREKKATAGPSAASPAQGERNPGAPAPRLDPSEDRELEAMLGNLTAAAVEPSGDDGHDHAAASWKVEELGDAGLANEGAPPGDTTVVELAAEMASEHLAEAEDEDLLALDLGLDAPTPAGRATPAPTTAPAAAMASATLAPQARVATAVAGPAAADDLDLELDALTAPPPRRERPAVPARPTENEGPIDLEVPLERERRAEPAPAPPPAASESASSADSIAADSSSADSIAADSSPADSIAADSTSADPSPADPIPADSTSPDSSSPEATALEVSPDFEEATASQQPMEVDAGIAAMPARDAELELDASLDRLTESAAVVELPAVAPPPRAEVRGPAESESCAEVTLPVDGDAPAPEMADSVATATSTAADNDEPIAIALSDADALGSADGAAVAEEPLPIDAPTVDDALVAPQEQAAPATLASERESDAAPMPEPEVAPGDAGAPGLDDAANTRHDVTPDLFLDLAGVGWLALPRPAAGTLDTAKRLSGFVQAGRTRLPAAAQWLLLPWPAAAAQIVSRRLGLTLCEGDAGLAALDIGGEPVHASALIKATLRAIVDKLPEKPMRAVVVLPTLSGSKAQSLIAGELASLGLESVMALPSSLAILHTARPELQDFERALVIEVGELGATLALVEGTTAVRTVRRTLDAGLREADRLTAELFEKELLREHAVAVADEPTLAHGVVEQVQTARREERPGTWEVSVAGATVALEASTVAARLRAPAEQLALLASDALAEMEVEPSELAAALLVSDEPLWPDAATTVGALLGVELEVLPHEPLLRLRGLLRP